MGMPMEWLVAVMVCWLLPAVLLLSAHMTSEKLIFNFIGPAFLGPPALLMRLILTVFRFFMKPQLPPRETIPITEQLSANWDGRGGGYRAGIGVYASVWTRDSFFGLFAPIPERGARLRALCDRLRDNRATVKCAGPYGHDSSCAPAIATYAHVPFQFNEVWYIISTLLGRAVMRARPTVLYRDEKYGQPVMDVNAQ